MSIELKIPTVGESISEVQISEWLKAEGDAVNKDESVAVIDSEKTTFELPAPESGRLLKILRQAGEIVRVGDTVAQLEPGASAPTEKKTKPETAVEMRAAPEPAREKQRPPQPLPDGEVAQPVEQKQPAPEESAPAEVERPETKPETSCSPAAEARRQKKPTPSPSRAGAARRKRSCP